MDPDLDGLRRFAGGGDRDRTPFFTGRSAQIDAMEETCERALEGFSEGQPETGATHLIQGAPGAGKTALLHELSRRWTERGAGAPLPLFMEFDTLYRKESLVLEIAEAVDPKAAERLRSTTVTHIRGGVSHFVDAGMSRETSTAPEAAALKFLKRAVPADGWTQTVCLIVDEIQTVDRGRAKAALVALHQNVADLPLVQVYAGLGDSHDVLREEGLTRLNPGMVHDIGALPGREAEEAVESMLDGFRVSRRDDGVGWPEYLAGLSEGWPQHLNSGMRALAAELRETGGRLADVNVACVWDRQRALREDTYGWRLTDGMRDARCLVAEVMRAVPEAGLEGFEVKDRIRNLARPLDDPDGGGWRLPKGRDEEWFLRHLVHQGALQRKGPTHYHCPIPTFREYLMRLGGLQPDREDRSEPARGVSIGIEPM